MRVHVAFAAAALLLCSVGAFAQSGSGGPTQTRDGLDTATQGKGAVNNSMPSGALNAETGPQSRPAYPSGSTTANPGAAFVKTTPVPATGPARTPPGVVKTETVTPGGGAVSRPQSPGVGQAATPPK